MDKKSKFENFLALAFSLAITILLWLVVLVWVAILGVLLYGWLK